MFGLRIEGSFMINFLLQIDYFMYILVNDLLSNSMIPNFDIHLIV